VTLPMELGTDSLNVAVAAGIFLYHFSRQPNP
jgi:tRNA G18 (ribose-2'-O)-methylase SpoU